MHAQELQIWKEVDGIFTADPRKVPSARLLNIITPEEASELTYYGSEGHSPLLPWNRLFGRPSPSRIKNVQNPRGPGTIIFPDLGSQPASAAPSRAESPCALNSPKLLLENGYLLDLSRRHPTAVTIKDSIVVLNIHSNRKNVSHGFFARIFSILDKYWITVDLISTSEVHVSMGCICQCSWSETWSLSSTSYRLWACSGHNPGFGYPFACWKAGCGIWLESPERCSTLWVHSQASISR